MSDEEIRQALVDLMQVARDLAMVTYYCYELTEAMYEESRRRGSPEIVPAALRAGIFGAGKALPQRDGMLQRIDEIARTIRDRSGTQG